MSATSSAQQTVLYSLLTVGGLATVRDIAAGRGPTVRVALGVAVTGMALSALAGPAPALASGMALLVLVSALTLMGAEVAGHLQAGIDPAHPSK